MSPIPDPVPPDSLVQRVRKLLDKAERTDNVHESEAFARKAAELVAQHRIDPEHLSASAESERDDLRIVEMNLGRGAYVRGRLSLLVAIANAHDVKVVFRATPEGTIALAAGHSTDLDVVEVMYHSLHQQASAQMAAIRKGTGAATQRFRRSFLFGFADRLGQIVAESRRRIEDSVQANEAAGTAIALRERAERVDDFVLSEWGHVRSATRPSPVQPTGYTSGVVAAERADVGRARIGGRRAIGPGRR